MTTRPELLRRNLALYPWYQAAGSFIPWLPVFFLFFLEHLTLPQALKLSAVYYVSVFLLEVPSGYFSDSFGRRITLLMASACGMVAYATFIFAEGFLLFAFAQFALAGFFSFKSGSDNSLLYDSLQALGRQSEYASREANATRFSMLAFAASAFIGGVSGLFDLLYPYVLSLAGAIVALVIVLRFTEPPRPEQAAPVLQQLRNCMQSLKHPTLLWLFAFFVIAFSLQHVPAEFNQPYIKLLQIDWFSDSDSSALISGCIVTISMLGGAVGASISMHLLERLGLQKLLLAGLAIMLLIITTMALVLHPVVLLLVLLRNFPMAFSEAPLLAAVAPHINSSFRATFLSLKSLAGRLGFALILFAVSGVVDTGSEAAVMSWSQLQKALIFCLLLAVIFIALLAVLQRFGGQNDNSDA